MPRSAGVIDVRVGERIASRRLAMGLSQSALGDRLGISFQQIQKYESGTNRVSASRLFAIAAVLGMAIGDFFPDGPPGTEAALEADERRWETGLRLMTATAEGRAVAAGFPLIADRSTRQALARVVRALSEAV